MKNGDLNHQIIMTCLTRSKKIVPNFLHENWDFGSEERSYFSDNCSEILGPNTNMFHWTSDVMNKKVANFRKSVVTKSLYSLLWAARFVQYYVLALKFGIELFGRWGALCKVENNMWEKSEHVPFIERGRFCKSVSLI